MEIYLLLCVLVYLRKGTSTKQVRIYKVSLSSEVNVHDGEKWKEEQRATKKKTGSDNMSQLRSFFCGLCDSSVTLR